jgi:hypothetical protein
VQVVAGEPAVHQFDTAEFENPVASACIQAGSFGIEDELTHVGLACFRKIAAKKFAANQGRQKERA